MWNFSACCSPINLFLSSRRRHTRFSRDWSSDVCSSDLLRRPVGRRRPVRGMRRNPVMPTYQIGHETVRVSRKGEVRGTSEGGHYRYDVHAVTSGIRTWTTAPSYWAEACVLSTALEAVADELGEGDRADWWTLYSRDIDSFDHPDTAAMYRVSSVSHYRTRPHSIDSRGETYPT